MPYMSLNREDNGAYRLSVRSGGRSGHCRSCGSQEPHSANIELSDRQLDDLASAIQTRHLLAYVARLESRISEVEGRTAGMVRLGGGPVYTGIAVAQAVPFAFCANGNASVQFATGGLVPPGTIAGTRVCDAVTGRDLGSAD